MAGIATTLGLGLSATPAAALDLRDSSPGAGQILDSTPDQIRLTFDEFLGGRQARITVEGPDGNASGGDARVFGSGVTQELESDLPNGRYTVQWSIGGGFGQLGQSGDFTFRIGPVPPAPRPTPVTPTRTKKPTPTPDESQSSTPTPRRTKLAPAVTRPPRALDRAVATPEPTNVPAPRVAGVASIRDEWLPPPVFWWSLLVVLAFAGYRLFRWHRARVAAAEEADGGGDAMAGAGLPETGPMTTGRMDSRPVNTAPIDTVPPYTVPPYTVPTHGAPTHSVPSYGVPSQSAPSYGVPSQSVPSQSVPSYGAPSHGVPGSVPPDPLAPGTAYPDSVPTGPLYPPSVPTGSAPTGSAPTGSVPTSSVPTGSVPPGGAPSHPASSDWAPSDWMNPQTGNVPAGNVSGAGAQAYDSHDTGSSRGWTTRRDRRAFPPPGDVDLPPSLLPGGPGGPQPGRTTSPADPRWAPAGDEERANASWF